MQQYMPMGSRVIWNYIREMGFITDRQADKLLGKTYADSRTSMINILKRTKIMEREPGVYFARNSNACYSKGMELCGWVILDNWKSGKDEMFLAVDKPAMVGLVKNNMLYELMYVDKNYRGMILALQEKFIGRIDSPESSDVKLIFVSDDKDMVDMISSMELVIPNTVAIVKDVDLPIPDAASWNDRFPVIEYYGA